MNLVKPKEDVNIRNITKSMKDFRDSMTEPRTP